MVPHPLGTRLPSSSGLLCAADRVGKYELRTAGACRAAPPVVLALRICSEGFGTTANQVQVLYSSGAQCGSATCFCGARLRAWSCTSLLIRENLQHPFLSDRILYHSWFFCTPAFFLFLISYLSFLSFLYLLLYLLFYLLFSLPPLSSRFSSLASPRLPSQNSGIFGTKITQSKVKPLASERGNFFPRQNCAFSKIALDKLPVT